MAANTTVAIGITIKDMTQEPIDRIVGRLRNAFSGAIAGHNFGPLASSILDAASPLSQLNREFVRFKVLAQAGILGTLHQAFQSLGGAISSAGDALSGFGRAMISAFAQLVTSSIEVGQRFEEIELRMNASFQGDPERAQRTIRFLDDLADRTSLTSEQVSRLGAQMTGIGITNLADSFIGSSDLSSLEAFTRILQTKGARANTVMTASVNALAEGTTRSVQSLERLLDVPLGDEFARQFAQTTDAGERFDMLMERIAVAAPNLLAQGEAMNNSWSTAVSNLSDRWNSVLGGIGMGLTDVLGPVLRELMADFNMSTTDMREKFREIGRGIGEFLAPLVRFVGQIIIAVTHFAMAHPFLMKMLAVFLLLGGAAAVVAGTAISILGSIVAIAVPIAAIVMYWSIIGPIVAAVASAVGSVLLPALVVGGLLLAAWSADLFNVRSIVTRIATAFRALYELISNEDGRTGMSFLSEETANELQDMGILGFTTDLWAAFTRLRDFVVSVWDTISIAGERAWMTIRGALAAAFPDQGQQILDSTSLMDFINGLSNADWEAIGVQVGIFIGDFIIKVTVLVTLLIQLLGLITQLQESIPDLSAGGLVGTAMDMLPGFGFANRVFQGAQSVQEAGAAAGTADSPSQGLLVPGLRSGSRETIPEGRVVGRNSGNDGGLTKTQGDAIIAGLAGVREAVKMTVTIDGQVIAEAGAAATQRESSRLGVGR